MNRLFCTCAKGHDALLGIKEVQIVYMLFLVNCYLLQVPRLASQPASNAGGSAIDFIWLELP